MFNINNKQFIRLLISALCIVTCSLQAMFRNFTKKCIPVLTYVSVSQCEQKDIIDEKLIVFSHEVFLRPKKYSFFANEESFLVYQELLRCGYFQAFLSEKIEDRRDVIDFLIEAKLLRSITNNALMEQSINKEDKLQFICCGYINSRSAIKCHFGSGLTKCPSCCVILFDQTIQVVPYDDYNNKYIIIRIPRYFD